MLCEVLVVADRGAGIGGGGGVVVGRGQEGGEAGVGGEVGAEARGPEGPGVGKEVKLQKGGFARSQGGSRVALKRETLPFSWLSTLFWILCSLNKKMCSLPSTTGEQWRVE